MFGFIRRAAYDGLKRRFADLEIEHEKLQRMFGAAVREHNILMDQWNELVRKINRNGGQQFLDGRRQVQLQFTKDELKSLLVLVHPDKHNGKETAVKLTQKILELRG